MHDIEYFDAEQPKSKTKIKQEMHQLQQLGKQLSELSATKLIGMPLDTKLRDAIETLQRINSHEAKRRQLQFIGKLMRSADCEAIQSALNKHKEKDQQRLRFDHLAEDWRQRLLDSEQGKQAQKDFFDHYPNVDHQQLRTLIRESLKERANNKAPRNQRKLFRYLRDFLLKQ